MSEMKWAIITGADGGMDMYEANIGMARKPETKELAR